MARCRNCGEKFTPRFSSFEKYCFEKDECIKAMAEDAKMKHQKKQLKDWKQKKKVLTNQSKTETSIKDELQAEINKLARMIDNDLPCISCGTTNMVQYAGGHRKSRGAHPNIRFNLHNIHKQCNNNCNKNLSGNPDGYDIGLEQRYGKEYLEMVHGLTNQYPKMTLTKDELSEKLILVRKIIRNFNTFQFNDPVKFRDCLNELIGIYKKV